MEALAPVAPKLESPINKEVWVNKGLHLQNKLHIKKQKLKEQYAP